MDAPSCHAPTAALLCLPCTPARRFENDATHASSCKPPLPTVLPVRFSPLPPLLPSPHPCPLPSPRSPLGRTPLVGCVTTASTTATRTGPWTPTVSRAGAETGEGEGSARGSALASPVLVSASLQDQCQAAAPPRCCKPCQAGLAPVLSPLPCQAPTRASSGPTAAGSCTARWAGRPGSDLRWQARAGGAARWGTTSVLEQLPALSCNRVPKCDLASAAASPAPPPARSAGAGRAHRGRLDCGRPDPPALLPVRLLFLGACGGASAAPPRGGALHRLLACGWLAGSPGLDALPAASPACCAACHGPGTSRAPPGFLSPLPQGPALHVRPGGCAAGARLQHLCSQRGVGQGACCLLRPCVSRALSRSAERRRKGSLLGALPSCTANGLLSPIPGRSTPRSGGGAAGPAWCGRAPCARCSCGTSRGW